MRRCVNLELLSCYIILLLFSDLQFSVLQFPLRESSTKALGRLLLYKAQVDPSDTALYKDVLSLLVTSTRDESSEVRRRALSAIKAVAKVCTQTILPRVNVILLKIYISH